MGSVARMVKAGSHDFEENSKSMESMNHCQNLQADRFLNLTGYSLIASSFTQLLMH